MTESNILWEQLTKKFIEVRDTLNNSGYHSAYRMAFKQPWIFYKNNTATESIEKLIKTYENH